MKAILRKLAKSHKSSKWVFLRAARCKQIIFNQSRKRRLPRSVSAAGFFKSLNDAGVRYVVLRWYEKLPNVDPDEDIDILIEDSDVKIIEKCTVRSARKGKIALDVYSTTGIANYGYRGVSYYPPKIAKRILDSAIIHERSRAKIPDEQHYFFSLIFHALYHKGFDSGFPFEALESKAPKGAGRNFERILREMASRLDYHPEFTLLGLDAFLDSHGWKPPLDTLEKLSKSNEFCRVLTDFQMRDLPAVEGLVVFIIREDASSPQDTSKIVEVLAQAGFDVLRKKVLDADEKRAFADLLRGGNWGSRASVMEGGLPAVVVVAYDKFPEHPSEHQRKRAPYLDNMRIPKVKKVIRGIYFKQILHSTDNCRQAAHYIQVTMPDSFMEIREKVDRIMEDQDGQGHGCPT